MRKWGALSWKRTWLWANTEHIGALDKGPMTPGERAGARPTTTRYRDKQGKTRFKGNSHLKSSQWLASNMLFLDFQIPIQLVWYMFQRGCFFWLGSLVEPGSIRTSTLQSWYHCFLKFSPNYDGENSLWRCAGTKPFCNRDVCPNTMCCFTILKSIPTLQYTILQP